MNERYAGPVVYLCRDCGYRGSADRMVAHVEATNHREVCLAHARREHAGAGRA